MQYNEHKIWKWRLYLLKSRFKNEGIWFIIRFYIHRVYVLIYSRMILGRTDIVIPLDARLGGVSDIRLGQGFTAGKGLWLEAVKEYPATGQKFSPKLIIGNRVNVGEYVHIGCNNSVIIGDDVLMGSKIYITDHNHGVYCGKNSDSPFVPPAKRQLTEGSFVKIGARCWIGEFVTILPGVTIGEGCIIGSHSTVTHDIPANSIAVGSPARVMKTWDAGQGVWKKL